jgi:hypothetical protein
MQAERSKDRLGQRGNLWIRPRERNYLKKIDPETGIVGYLARN